MSDSDSNLFLRAAAFAHLRRLNETRDQVTAAELKYGFFFDGQRIPLINLQRRIFKLAQMRDLLSIKTVFPKVDAKVWYDDVRNVHRQIYDGDETADCALMGSDPSAADSRWLRDAMERRVPIIYFLGVSPRRYQAIFPVFVVGWEATALIVKIAFGLPQYAELTLSESSAERRYALQAVKQKLYQASFREAVITAYKGRCALSGLPEPLLLDAAHIIGDEDELPGRPIVPNGMPLSKIHHAAFASNLIGVDPDFRIHVSDRLMRKKDGHNLEALKRLNKRQLHLPDRVKDWPDRGRLAVRFEGFLAAA